MNLNELRDKAYKTACKHGFHDKALSKEHYLMLVITELSEAVEADRKSKYANIPRDRKETIFDPKTFHEENIYFVENFEKYVKDTVEDELADACIRLFDLAGFINIDLEDCYNEYDDVVKHLLQHHQNKGIFTEEMFAVCHSLTNRIGFVENTICSTLGLLMIICHAYNIDIEWHIEQKMKYNSLRENLHGKKY